MSEGKDSTSLALRPMTPEDLAEVSRIGIESKSTWGYSPQEMQIFAEELTLSEAYLNGVIDAQVAIQHGKMLGYYTLRVHDDGVTELDYLFVSAARLNQGVGGQLLLAAIDSARRRGASTLLLISDPNAEGFYLRYGAIKAGDHQSSIPGRTIPIMEIPLSPSGS